MARAVTRAKEEQERLDAIEQDRRKVKGVLDQLTKSLEAYEDDDDLLQKITELYDALGEFQQASDAASGNVAGDGVAGVNARIR